MRLKYYAKYKRTYINVHSVPMTVPIYCSHDVFPKSNIQLVITSQRSFITVVRSMGLGDSIPK